MFYCSPCKGKFKSKKQFRKNDQHFLKDTLYRTRKEKHMSFVRKKMMKHLRKRLMSEYVFVFQKVIVLKFPEVIKKPNISVRD